MKTNIELTKGQYEVLISALGVAGAMYGVMGDMVDKKYKINSSKLDDLEDHILKYAHEVGCLDMVEVYNKKRVISEEYMDKQMEDVFEYDEFNFWDTLPRELAERDLTQKLGEREFVELDDIKRIHAIYDIEMKYRDEFEKHGVDRLRVIEE